MASVILHENNIAATGAQRIRSHLLRVTMFRTAPKPVNTTTAHIAALEKSKNESNIRPTRVNTISAKINSTII